MIERKFTSSIFRQTDVDEFRLKRVNGMPESNYRIPTLFPHLRSPLRRLRNHEGKLLVAPKAEEETVLSNIFTQADEMGIELGRKDPAVKILRVSAMAYPITSEKRTLIPDGLQMRINDGQGNDVTFHLTYQMDDADGEGRDWHKIVTRIEKATIDGKPIALTHEMHADGITFKSHNMQEILASSKTEDPLSAYVRQETPCNACFIDGHKSSGGTHELGCTCRDERMESLKIINEKGGVSCLMPGTGNGNGSKPEDRQRTVRSSAYKMGLPVVSYHPIYESMGLKPDNRGDALAISTFIMEHLFRFGGINNITTLTDNPAKRDIWNKYKEGRTITTLPLESSKRDHTDFAHKQEAHGYIASPAPITQPAMI